MSGPQLDARLRLLAQDESARILAEAARNIRTLATEVGRTGQATQQSMRRSKESTDEFAKSIADATIGTLGLVTSVGGAVETVRQSVIKFADVSSMMSRIGREGNLTKDQVANLRREFTTLANQTKFAFDEIGKAYRDFQSKTELTGEAAKSAFGDIARAASYAGVEIPSMTRAYVAAMGTLKVSQQDMKGVMATWVKELPGSMDEFAEAAPRATAEMARFGLTGRQNAIELGAIFNQLGTTFGNARAAGNHFQATLGAIGSTPVLAHTFYEAVRAGSGLTDALEKVIGQLDSIGALDPSEKGLLIAEKLGVNSESQRALIAIRDHMGSIRNGAREAAAAVSETNRKMVEGGESPKRAIHLLSNAWDELQTSIGETSYALGAGAGMKQFTAALNDLKKAIDNVREALELLQKGDIMGALKKLGDFFQGAMNPSSFLFGRGPQLANPLTAPFAAQRMMMDYFLNRGGRGETEFDKRFRGEDSGQEENTKALKDLTDELRKRAGAAPASYMPTSLGGLGGPEGGAVPRGFRSGGGYSVQGQQFGGGGGAGGGGGGGITPGPSAPGGGQVPKSMPPAVGGGGGGLENYQPQGSAGSDPALAADRARFDAELAQKPWLAERMMQISLGENTDPQANQAVMETIYNRASQRGTSLEEAMKDVSRGGYYPGTTFSGGARNMRNPRMRAMAEEHFRRARGGSNVSNYATDNSSQGLAYTERYGGAMGGYGRPGQRPGKFTFQSEFGGRGTGTRGTETFFSPGWGGGGRASRAAYLAWRQRLDTERAAGLNQPALTQMPDTPTEAPPELRAPEAPSFDERFGAAYRGRQSSLEDAQRLRSDLERPIKMSVEAPQMPSQLVPRFRRASARESLQREVRDARWLSYSDIGAA
ncbi:hypothetical protein [Bradyrhizobium paxllaeri]|uniref:hypothetical protein n=1 Tax=Bradyrhizobium paxllaeri TaxID=190148 RepID=UPI000810B661|nr:hypothetical protein [Bradyrhizobium paxllaeri]